MTALESAMQSALEARPEVAALACMDGRAGLLLAMCVNGEVSPEQVELAALSAPQLCTTPSFGTATDGDEAAADESFVASSEWIHAFVRVPERPDLLVVGLAERGANITLLRAWLGDLARRVGQAA